MKRTPENNVIKLAAKPLSDADYRRAVFDMEPAVCDIMRQVQVAMEVQNVEDLFLHVVTHLHTMVTNFHADYQAIINSHAEAQS